MSQEGAHDCYTEVPLYIEMLYIYILLLSFNYLKWNFASSLSANEYTSHTYHDTHLLLVLCVTFGIAVPTSAVLLLL